MESVRGGSAAEESADEAFSAGTQEPDYDEDEEGELTMVPDAARWEAQTHVYNQSVRRRKPPPAFNAFSATHKFSRPP